MVDAEIASLFIYPAFEIGRQGTRGFILEVEANVDLSISLAVELSLVNQVGFRHEFLRPVVEAEVGVIFEYRFHRYEEQFEFCLQKPGHCTVQPAHIEPAGKLAVEGCQPFAPEVEVDLEPVGLDGLDLDLLFEHSSPGLHPGDPVAGKRIVGSPGTERIDAAHGACTQMPGVQLPERVYQFEHNRLLAGQEFLPVFRDEGEPEGVARSPHAALTVDEALEALLDFCSGSVEVAQRKGAAVVEL